VVRGVERDDRKTQDRRHPGVGECMLTLNEDMAITSVIPTSSISITSPEKHRTQTRPCGRFFVWVPTRNREASFLVDQNESEEESSNGLIMLLLLKGIEWGFLSWF